MKPSLKELWHRATGRNSFRVYYTTHGQFKNYSIRLRYRAACNYASTVNGAIRFEPAS